MRIVCTLMICLAIILGAQRIAVTLDEVCPEPTEGTEFLSVRST